MAIKFGVEIQDRADGDGHYEDTVFYAVVYNGIHKCYPKAYIRNSKSDSSRVGVSSDKFNCWWTSLEAALDAISRYKSQFNI